MRLTGLLLTVWFLVIRLALAADDGDLARFRNGDTLHGTLLGGDSTGLKWQRSGVPQPIQFELTNLAEVDLAPRPPRTSRVVHHFLVKLTNGDQLAGDLVSLDETNLTLDTWYAGRLTLKRVFLQSLESRAALPNVLYSGPTDIKDWKTDQSGAWTYKQGALYSRMGMYSVIGKDVGLPDLADIEFDIAWHGVPVWIVGLYNSDPNNIQGSPGYMLSCSGDNVSISRVGGNNGAFGFNHRWSNKRTTRTKTHVTILVSKPKKTITVYFDKVLAKQWTDPEEFAGKGSGLGFMSTGQCEVRLSKLQVLEWDGRLDPETAAASTNATEDLLSLANSDKVSGTIRSIRDGELSLTTSFADVKIPVDRLVTVNFTGKKSQRARRQSADVRAIFPDQSRFTVALKTLDDKVLAGESENCGPVTVAFDALDRLQFNVYEKSTAEDDPDDWAAPAKASTTDEDQ